MTIIVIYYGECVLKIAFAITLKHQYTTENTVCIYPKNTKKNIFYRFKIIFTTI